jgi:hypothetical protein
MGDEGIPIGQAVGADTLGDAGSEDLLGAAAADAQQEFEGGAVDKRPGQALEFADDVSSTGSCNSTAVAAMDYTGSCNWAVGVYFPPPLASRNIASRS